MHPLSHNALVVGGPEVSDDLLISAIQTGDAGSVELLFTRYARVLKAIAYRVLHDAFEAEDVVQDMFCEIRSKCSSFDHQKGSARSWLFKVAYHSAISRRRYLTAHCFTNQSGLDTVEDLAAKDWRNASVLPEVHPSIHRRDLQKVCECLSENQRRTLELFFCDGYTLDEIATEMGQSKGNVRHHYFRGLEKLRKEVFSKKRQPSAV